MTSTVRKGLTCSVDVLEQKLFSSLESEDVLEVSGDV